MTYTFSGNARHGRIGQEPLNPAGGWGPRLRTATPW